MKIKRYFIITSITSVFTLLFAIDFVFASNTSNIGRAVYGVLTETYNGASIDNPSAGADYAHNWGSPVSSEDRIEGAISTSVGSQWWFGVCFDTPQDMSAYTGGRIYFSAKVPTTIDITNTGNHFKLEDTSGSRFVYFYSDSIKRIDNHSEILSTKIINDNQWHTYYIDLSSFTDVDLTNIIYLFVVGNTTNNNTLLIDNVYWTKAPTEARSFNVTVKNISDNQVLTGVNEKITWTQSCFRESWTVAEQYIELDLDQESTNWYIRVYLNNGKASRNGLYWVDDSDEKEIVLPMAWRVRPDFLPNNDGDTLQIAEVYHAEADASRLYDYGKHGSTDPWWYPWIYAIEGNKSLGDGEIEFTKVWDIRGIHTYAYDHEAWNSLANFYEKKPKIYFAADCSKALGGLIYRANVVTELFFE